MGDRTIKLGFIGTGNWARSRHLPALDYIRLHGTSDYTVELRGICSLDREQARVVADEYGFGQVYEDLAELVSDPDLNAIAILVRPWHLRDVLEQVVPRGLPLFSEKTPGLSAAEAESMATLVDVPNVMALNRRYARLNNRYKQIIEAMDALHFVEAHFLRHDRTDEPFAIETAIHIVDLLEYLFGAIEGLQSDALPNPLNETTARIVRLRFASGLPGLLKIMPCTGMLVERVEAHSNALSAILHGGLNDDRGRISLYRGGQHGGNAEVIEGDPEMVVEQGFLDEYDEFFRVVLDGITPRASFQSIVSGMRVTEAIHAGRNLP